VDLIENFRVGALVASQEETRNESSEWCEEKAAVLLQHAHHFRILRRRLNSRGRMVVVVAVSNRHSNNVSVDDFPLSAKQKLQCEVSIWRISQVNVCT
jgi:hypothetical protein